MHRVLSMGELMTLGFLALLQAGLWAKLLLLNHQDRDLLLLQRYEYMPVQLQLSVSMCAYVCQHLLIVSMINCTWSYTLCSVHVSVHVHA